MKKRLLFFVVFLFFIPLVLGATIHGKVFDYNLRLVENSIVSINTVPEQIVVSVDGSYSFNVPVGEYILTAELKDEFDIVRFSVQDNISVVDDGDYVRDLILFPREDLDELDLEEDINQDLEEEKQEEQAKEMPVFTRILISLVLLIILAFILWIALKDKGKKRDLTGLDKIEQEDDLAGLLAFIRKHKRVTQKQIRKEFPLSEAKISLMITDLESQGKIRKIKKGRGNVVVYVKD